jgi:hypothetical protein
MGEPIKTLVEGRGGWHWSVDDDDAVYSGVCATEHEARAAMDDTVRSLLRAEAADQVEVSDG